MQSPLHRLTFLGQLDLRGDPHKLSVTVPIIRSVSFLSFLSFQAHILSYFTLEQSAFEKCFCFSFFQKRFLPANFLRQTLRQLNGRPSLRRAQLCFLLRSCIHCRLSLPDPSLLGINPFFPISSEIDPRLASRGAAPP
jgi:hypothetical protein